MLRSRPLPADQPLLGEKRQNPFGIALRLLTTGVCLPAQLHSGGHAGQRNLRVAKVTLQTQPGQGTRLVKRATARVFSQQTNTHIQVRGQRAPLRPMLGQGVHVQGRFGIAMQVEHHVSIAGVIQEHTLHALQLSGGSWQFS